MKKIWLAAAALLASACSSFEVSSLDPSTGYLKASVKATTIINKPFDLDARKDLIMVQNDPFVLGQTKAIGYFNEVITNEELEVRIIQNNLGDKVASVRERIGINYAAKHYKPFLWLRFDISDTKTDHAQIYLTDPLTMEDVFAAEVYMDTIWAGVNDDNAWYPLFNELIAYVRANSATYGKTAAAS
jgi:predicted HAD superfamily phosphohydrolase YqeG